MEMGMIKMKARRWKRNKDKKNTKRSLSASRRRTCGNHRES